MHNHAHPRGMSRELIRLSPPSVIGGWDTWQGYGISRSQGSRIDKGHYNTRVRQHFLKKKKQVLKNHQLILHVTCERIICKPWKKIQDIIFCLNDICLSISEAYGNAFRARSLERLSRSLDLDCIIDHLKKKSAKNLTEKCYWKWNIMVFEPFPYESLCATQS